MTESDGDDLSTALAAAREATTPETDERERMRRVVADLRERATAAVADLPAPADEASVLQVGSTARGTWLPGDRDVDLFVRFPTALDRDELEQFGLRVGHTVLPEGVEEFAEHPYVRGEHDGFDVDLVPCFDVPNATAARTAVDRTPFHTAYLEARLDDDLAADVRVFKRFLTAVGAYGSDLRTRGFSGYLAELLVAEHDGVVPLLRAAADWTPPVRFDPEDHGQETFDDPLVVIDPTDPERNVAAVCAAENVARLQHHARRLLADPDPDRFRPRPTPSVTPATVRDHLRQRETAPVAVVFDAPNVVDDQLYPQLRRSLNGVERELDGRGFDAVRTSTFAADHADSDGRRGAVLLFELADTEIPAVERHEGPPVHVGAHAAGFYEKYADGDAYGPFLDGDRYVVERDREYHDAVRFLRETGFEEVALGTQVETALADGYSVVAGDDVAALAERFDEALARHFRPRV